ncbi:MAG TPA: hypothetical protein PKO36_07065, partial [Candidatus Hydrogenedentes bacterium]|nr:hypothetical protein [Candidatus Hydrogenedentota bacterium]
MRRLASLALAFIPAAVCVVLAAFGSSFAHGAPFDNAKAACTLSKTTILFPRPYTTLIATADAAAMPLPIVVETDCPDDTRQVDFVLDTVAIGSASQSPYTVTSVRLADMNVGLHALGVVARSLKAIAVTDFSSFTLAKALNTTDVNANGLPDNPFFSLNAPGTAWLARAYALGSDTKRTVAAIRWRGMDEDDLPPGLPAVIAVSDPSGPARRVTVRMPQSLLREGESGILALLMADDLTGLLGDREAAAMGREPYPVVWADAVYLAVVVLISADNGITYSTAAPSRIAANPIHVVLEGLGAGNPGHLTLRAHPCGIATRGGVVGPELLSTSGDWNVHDIANVTFNAGRLEFDLLNSSVIAPYENPSSTGEGEGEGE